VWLNGSSYVSFSATVPHIQEGSIEINAERKMGIEEVLAGSVSSWTFPE
jgi:hypothetical protein